MMEELRRFITVDNHEAVKIGDLARTLVWLPVIELQFDTEDFSKKQRCAKGRKS